MRQQAHAVWAVTFVAVFSLVSSTGCGTSGDAPAASGQNARDPSSPRLVGRWQGQVWVDEAQLAEVLAPEQIEALKATTMDVAFEADGRMTLSGVNGDEPYTSHGRWQILAEEGATVRLKSIEDAGHEKEIQVRFENDDTFSMSLPEPVTRMGAMQFRRLQ